MSEFFNIDEPEFAERARATRRRYLQGTLQQCERQLKRLGKSAEAWKALQVTWNGTPRPIIGYGPEARELLGEQYVVMPNSTPKKPPMKQEVELPAYRAIQRAASVIEKTEGVTTAKATSLAIERNPALYARYRVQRLRRLPKVRIKDAWRQAQTAAVMGAALERLNNPTVMFAAGVAEAEYHQINHQQKLLREAERKIHRQIEEAARQARRNAGKDKAGKRMPQTVLIHETLRLLTRAGCRPDWKNVLAVLMGKHADANELLEALRDAVNPIELQDVPPVDLERAKLFFRFKNRPDREMTLARFRNAVSEAVYTES